MVCAAIPRLAALAALVATVATAFGEPTAADKQRAAELAAQSAEHYKRGELEIAVALLRQAYALYPQPNLLYNLGRSLEKLGDAKGAIDAYEQYLAAAKSVADRDAIEHKIAALKATLAPEPVPQPAEPPVHSPTPVPSAPSSPPSTPPPSSHVVVSGEVHPSALPWLTLGAAVALGGTGGAFGYLASQRHDSAVASPVGTTAASLQTEAQHFALAANVLFAAAGVAAIAAIVWEIHDRHRIHRAELHVAPTGVAVSWHL